MTPRPDEVTPDDPVAKALADMLLADDWETQFAELLAKMMEGKK